MSRRLRTSLGGPRLARDRRRHRARRRRPRHRPSTTRPASAGRPELTAAGDAEVAPQLDAAEADLATLADQVEALGIQARGALAALNGSDTKTVETAIAEGDRLVADVIRPDDRQLRARAGRGPVRRDAGGRARGVSDAIVARHAALVAALDATDGLERSWARLSVGSVAATKMSTLLGEHDRLVGQAAERGRLAKYAEAIDAHRRGRGASSAAARAIRDQLANTVDVSMLDEWINRNADYDVALRDLYAAHLQGRRQGDGGDPCRGRRRRPTRARRLPPDTRGLVVIMADIGRGGMNGAVIAIEEARAKLADAIESGTASRTPEPGRRATASLTAAGP